MSDNTFLSVLLAAIDRNGGRVPGEDRFYKESGLTRTHLWEAGFETSIGITGA